MTNFPPSPSLSQVEDLLDLHDDVADVANVNMESHSAGPMMNGGGDEKWDPDVLLSNAVLPEGEGNPLLELNAREGIEDDFDKMLSEWDNHMGNIQVRDAIHFARWQMLTSSSLEG